MQTTTRIIRVIFLCACLVSALAIPGSAAQATTRYAAPDGATTGDCTSWATACDLQHALSVAVAGDEVWVKAGTYKPTASDDRSATFQLESGVAIYGGFAGTETARNQRDWTANATVLSGDLGMAGDAADNSYHVVTGNDADATAILDGFSVLHGNADSASAPDHVGAGIYNYYGSPTLRNLSVSGNTATGGAAGMWNEHSSPSLTNVTFTGNSVTEGPGGAMVNTEDSAPALTGVIFSGNSALDAGGGMYNDQCSPTLTNVTFVSNSVEGGNGGALYNDLTAAPTLINVTFHANTARMSSGLNGGHGGAIYNYATDPGPTLINVTFSHNMVFGFGGNPAYGAAMYTNWGRATVINAIVWDNSPDQIHTETDDPATYVVSVDNSIVQGGCPANTACSSVSSDDPLLGTLSPIYGGPVPTMPLLPGSPAIDAADDAECPATDARGAMRPMGPHCDIGAFESSRFTLAIIGGDNQSAPVGRAFAAPLRVSVTPNEAAEPVNGGFVTFAAPGSGASAGLSPTAATIIGGEASANATANGVVGAYAVSATTVGGNDVTFNLENTELVLHFSYLPMLAR